MMSRTKVEVQNCNGKAAQQRLKTVNTAVLGCLYYSIHPIIIGMSCISADADELGPDRREPRGDQNIVRVIAERSAI